MELRPEDIQEILKIFSESELEELRLEIGETRLHVSKRSAPLGPEPTSPVSPAADAAISDPPAAPDAQPADAAPPVLAASSEGGIRPASDDALVDVRSPLLGVFYRRPAPDQPPFVEPGATVAATDPVCIVDVMKMFTQVPAGAAGRISEICVEDGQLVEHGQVLMRIEPA